MSRSLLALALVVAAPLAAQSPVAEVRDATPGVRFTLPLGVEVEPFTADRLHPDRLYVLEKGRMVRTLVPGDAASTDFLDLTDRASERGEGGLLGLAFHPNYASNGRLFVSYTAPVDDPQEGVLVLVSRLSEFARSETDPLRADPASERVLLEVDQPYDNHNGGTVDFGADGLLYYSLGDGGSGGDPLGSGQDPTTLLGSILRIDVDDVPEGAPYGIPDDNPFAATDGPERDEIFAYGFRNPFKFDAGASGVWAGDVGQDAWEEVNVVEAGGNYGWNEVEGPDCYPPGSTDCDPSAYAAPRYAYDHSVGASITGGYVLDGVDAALSGAYLFGDFLSGRLWALEAGAEEPTLLLDRFPNGAGGQRGINISSIDPAPDGLDILVTDLTSGTIYRIARAGTSAEAGPRASALALAGPNPFADRTALRVDAPGVVRVVLYDVLGRETAVLWDGPAPRGEITVEGEGLAPGVYTAVATVGERRSAVRLVRMR